MLELTVLPVILLSLAVLTGCGVSPQRQFAFSPDGERIAYINYPNIGAGVNVFFGEDDAVSGIIKSVIGEANLSTGITIKDLRTGTAAQIYKAKPHFVVHAVFWPAQKNTLYFVESIYFIARKKNLDDFIFNIKEIDPGTREVISLKSRKTHVSNYKFDDIYATTALINFDEQTGVMTAGSKVWTLGEKNSALDMIISQYTDEVESGESANTGDFNLSPDRKYMSFVVLNDQATASIRVMNLDTLAVRTVYSADCFKQYHCLFLMNGTRWSPDGRYLYFTRNIRENFRLMRYDTRSGQSRKLLDEQIISFDVFSGGGLLILHECGGKGCLSTLNADGTVLETSEVVFPGSVTAAMSKTDRNKRFAFAHLKIAPDGKYAAAAGITNAIETSPIVIYDLGARSSAVLAETDNERLVAGLFQKYHNKNEEAEKLLEAAGDAGAVFLYPLYRREGRDAEAGIALEKALSLFGKRAGEDAHYVLGRIYNGLGSEYEDAAREQYLLSSKPMLGKAYYYLSVMSKGEEKIGWLEKALDEFRGQGCLEKPMVLCGGDIRLISNMPLKLADMYLQRRTREGAAAAAGVLEPAKKYPYTMKWYGSEVYCKSGVAYERAGDCHHAIENYRECIAGADGSVKQLEEMYAKVMKLESADKSSAYAVKYKDLFGDVLLGIMHEKSNLRSLEKSCRRSRK